jgi:hypothetical protein
MLLGLLWDISWHASIGRDTFWTAPHLAIHLGGLLCGLSAGWLALTMTLRHDEDALGVRFWGFRAPFGAWITIWGAFTMVTSAPFDDWWHRAYGLDVKIISPPHVVLAVGFFSVLLGVMLQAVALQNRQVAETTSPATKSTLIFGLTAGLMILAANTFLLEYSAPNLQHGALFYQLSAAVYPLLLVAAARAGRGRWPATTAAAAYLVLKLAVVWILPLVPAVPRLAPIFNPVTHLWPPMFPLLLIVPAFGMDLVMRWPPVARRDDGGGILAASALATVFLLVFLGSQWLFADFLLSSAGRNRIFVADEWTYMARPGLWRYQFWPRYGPLTLSALAWAWVLGLLSSRCGLALGSWMRRIRR